MYSSKKSLAAGAGLSLFAAVFVALTPLVCHGQGAKKPQPAGPRRFYSKQTEHNGSQALSACAEGYHMGALEWLLRGLKAGV